MDKIKNTLSRIEDDWLHLKSAVTFGGSIMRITLKLLLIDTLTLLGIFAFIVLVNAVYAAFASLILFIWYLAAECAIKMPCHWNTAIVYGICFSLLLIYSIVRIWLKGSKKRPL